MCFVSWHVKWTPSMCQAKVEQRGQNGWRGTEESKGFVFFVDLPLVQSGTERDSDVEHILGTARSPEHGRGQGMTSVTRGHASW